MSDDGFREAELLNQYVRGAYEEEGESDLSLDGTTSSRSASESSNSEAETFFSLDEDGVSVRCEMLKGATIQYLGGGGAGVFVARKLFISTGLGGALKISHFFYMFI